MTHPSGLTRWTLRIALAGLALGLAACSSGGGGGGGGGTEETSTVGSSATSSGSTGVYTEDGATKATTPSASSSSEVALLTLPNSGSAVGAQTIDKMQKTAIPTSLTSVDGTSVDPAHDVGLAFAYQDKKLSFFRLSDTTELSVYDTKTSQTRIYSGVYPYVAGGILDPDQQFAVIATADGFEVVDYSDPSNPTKDREVASKLVDADDDGDATNDGVEVNENFGYHPSLTVGGTDYPMILTGGGFSGLNGEFLTLVDASTGDIYRPDSSTSFPSLTLSSAYIDAMAVDTDYNVALLAPEYEDNPILVDLNQLTLDKSNGTYNLPGSAIKMLSDVDGNSAATPYYSNVSIESSKHMVMLGEGFGGTRLMAAELKDPSSGLGFKRSAKITMPSDTDNNGDAVSWAGSKDPHGTAAYVTASDHPEYGEPVALGLWRASGSNHLAVIDLNGILDGVASSGSSYDPSATSPKDVAYFAIP